MFFPLIDAKPAHTHRLIFLTDFQNKGFTLYMIFQMLVLTLGRLEALVCNPNQARFEPSNLIARFLRLLHCSLYSVPAPLILSPALKRLQQLDIQNEALGVRTTELESARREARELAATLEVSTSEAFQPWGKK